MSISIAISNTPITFNLISLFDFNVSFIYNNFGNRNQYNKYINLLTEGYKMKKKLTLLLALCLIVSTMLMGCSKSKDTSKEGEEKQYQYYTAEQLKTAIENKDDIYLIDIQPKEDYDAHHIVGTVPTYAYPADTDDLRSKIDVTLDEINKTDKPIIVICPGGGGGAKNTIDYLTTKSVDAKRMFILEKGQKGWPYDELLEK